MADFDRPTGFTIRPATPEDVPELSEVLAVALFDDPPARWHIPDDERRTPIMQEFFALSLTALYLPHRLVFTTNPPVAACCWVPPGAWPPSGREAQDLESKISRVFMDYPLTFKVFDMLDANQPSEPHYYLPFMGVLPDCRAAASAPHCCAWVWNGATVRGCPPTSTPPTREAGLFTCGMGSK